MSADKRKIDDSCESTSTKRPRFQNEHANDPISEATPSENQFEVEIKLRSASKAARNDPKPAGYFQAQFNRLLSGASVALEESEDSGKSITPDSVMLPSDHDASTVNYGIATSADLGASRPALANQEAGELKTPGDEDNSEELMEEESESESKPDSSEFAEFAEFDWLEAMDGFVTCTERPLDGETRAPVGFCHAKLIRRGQIRATFYHEMEDLSRETSMLAFELFDRYGRLRSELKDHTIRKGSGVWNEELDGGDILLIEEVRVSKKYRRRGLGKKVVGAMVDTAREKAGEIFAFVWPSFFNRDLRTEIEGLVDSEDKDRVFRREEAAAVGFYRSMGFRRIGSTRWFGLACRNGHPSHMLAPVDDYDPPAPRCIAPNPGLQPLQQILMQSQDQECLIALGHYLQKTPTGDPSWLATDADGNTLLHIAGLNFRAASVDWIMKQEFGPQMLEKRNNEGDLPLEAVLMELENIRTRRAFHGLGNLTITTSDKFEGHGDEAVVCLAALKGMTRPTAIDLARLSYGCTCGQCVAGFLSPRMSFALLCRAEIDHDILSYCTEQESGQEWVEFVAGELNYIPDRVRENLKTNKSMRQGFTNLCDHIATCLRTKLVPNEVNVLDARDSASEWPPVTKNFLQRGGSVESVMLRVIQGAMDEDALAGGGMFAEDFGDEIHKLPKCRNDHEFGFVSGMCGYRRISQMQYVTLMGEPTEEP